MIDQAPSFVLLSIALLVVVAIVFMMKYLAQMYQARLEGAKVSETTSRIAALDEKTGDLEKRLSGVEKLLREVE